MKKYVLFILFILIPSLFIHSTEKYGYLYPNPFNKLEKINKKGNSHINWSKGYALAWGKSEVNMDNANVLHSRMQAERKADVKAIKDLTDMLVKLRVDSFKTIYDYINGSDNFAVLFNKYIHEHAFKLMPVTKNYTTVKSGIVFNFFGKNSLLEVFFKALKNEPMRRVPMFNNKTHMETHNYTGLVIDARNFDFTPSLFPAIFVIDKHGVQRTIFSFHHLNRKRSLRNGSVRYSTTSYNVFQDDIVGPRPYYCNAEKVSGEFNTDLFISREDAIKLLSSPYSAKRLEEGRILIIVKK